MNTTKIVEQEIATRLRQTGLCTIERVKLADKAADELERLKVRDKVLCEVLRRWLCFSSDVIPSCAAGEDELRMLQERTERLLPNAEVSGEPRSGESA